MSYLLDTNLVSELRKRPGRIDVNVAAWGATQEADQQFLSAITVFEMELGVLQVERRDAFQGRMLRHWFEASVLGFSRGARSRLTARLRGERRGCMSRTRGQSATRTLQPRRSCTG